MNRPFLEKKKKKIRNSDSRLSYEISRELPRVVDKPRREKLVEVEVAEELG